MKECKVLVNDDWVNAVFYGVFQKAWVVGESLIVGGHKAGQMAHPVAVVDWGEGLKEVLPESVKEVAE